MKECQEKFNKNYYSINTFSCNGFINKNINNSSVAKQGLNKEFEGGKSFSFETEPKIITIKKQVNNLDEITGLLKNRLRNIDDNSEEGKDNIRADFYDSVVF